MMYRCRSAALVSGVLLNPHSPALRAATFKALREICLVHQGPDLIATYVWLLRQLVQCRAQALQCSAANKEYFALLLEVGIRVGWFGSAWFSLKGRQHMAQSHKVSWVCAPAPVSEVCWRSVDCGMDW